VGDPAGSNATAGLALRVTGTHKPLHHDNVEIYIHTLIGILEIQYVIKLQKICVFSVTVHVDHKR
jgi:hypothetical protein